MDNSTIQSAAAILRAKQNLALNQQTQLASFGGRFTPQGQLAAAQEAQVNGHDLYTAHHMVGLGQTLQGYC